MGLNVNKGNSSHLDIYLTGMTDGWIAIGFSNSGMMVGGWREGGREGGGGERRRERERSNVFCGVLD